MYLLPPPTATPTSPATANDFKAKLLGMWGILPIKSKGSVCIRGRCRSGAPLARLALMGAALPRGGQMVSGLEVRGLPAGLFEIASVIWIAMGQARGGVPTIMSSIKHSLPKPASPLPTHSGRPIKVLSYSHAPGINFRPAPSYRQPILFRPFFPIGPISLMAHTRKLPRAFS